jgi:hypothetical protein
MWDALSDDMILCIAWNAPLAALHVLRRLETRCARIDHAKSRLVYARRMLCPPFNYTLKQLIGDQVHVTFVSFLDGAVGVAEMEQLCSAIAAGALPSIQELHLDCNNFGDAGANALAGVIANRSLKLLEVLALSGNDIGDAGVIALADAIKPTVNPSGALAKLDMLFLQDNRIGDEGFKALASTIVGGGMANLQTLLIFENQIDEAGNIAMVDAVKSFGTLSLAY